MTPQSAMKTQPNKPARRRRGLLSERCTPAFVASFATVGALWLAALLCLRFVPLPSALFAGPAPDWEFLDRNGEPLRTARADKGPFRQQVDYADIPRGLVEATLAAEDRRFWQHRGVDYLATIRAAFQFVWHRRVVSGGSTITQQLIKLAEPRPRTFRTKTIEAIQALRLEQVWNKQRILCEYLNRLDYGNFNRGCAMAAEFYFGKPLRDLSPAESALLAALPQAPSRLNPTTHFESARRRQQWVLGQMRRDGWLDQAQSCRALAEPLRLARPNRVFEAPHFLDLVLSMQTTDLREACQTAPGGDPPGPAGIRTTLDLPLNRFAESTLRQHLSRLKAQHVSNGAVVVLDNRTGDVLALVGSGNYFSPAAGQVNGAWALRSAGSTFKPFTYLLALELGATPASVVADVPAEFGTATGLFAPLNYNRHCYGPMRYRQALANSLNISAVKVLASIGGPEPLKALLQDCGISTLAGSAEHYGLGLTIGNAEARLLELANAYACLARLGEYRPYRLLRDPEMPSPGPGRRIAAPAACYLVADILGDNEARTLAFGAESALRFDFPVACKTGTSSDFRDNWALGYTPEFTVGVWVGNFDGSPMMHVSGVSGAAPVMHEVFEELHRSFGTTWYPQPTNIAECLVHPITGHRLCGQSSVPGPSAVREKFITGNPPPNETLTDYVPGPNLRLETSESRPACVLGAEYTEWFRSGDNSLSDRAVLASRTEALRIVFPLPGTRIYLNPDRHDDGRRLSLQAAGAGLIEWRSQSLPIKREGQKQVAMLTEGRHEMSVREPASGREARTWIEVIAR
jgi:penicillin-binding protein 1C